jgi:hypothetical protein
MINLLEGAGVWALTNALAILQPAMMNLLEGAGVWALTNALTRLQPSMMNLLVLFRSLSIHRGFTAATLN